MPDALKESGEFLPGMATDIDLQSYGNNLYNCPKELWLRVMEIRDTVNNRKKKNSTK